MGYSILHRKESIISTTIDLMNQSGVKGVSTREVANRLKISEGTIFKHFPKKNDLILAVLDYYCQFDSDIFISAKSKVGSSKEAIKFMINAYVEYYENYPEITVINQSYDALVCDSDLEGKIKDIFNTRKEHMVELINVGKSSGEFSKTIDSDKLACIITGTNREIFLKWRLSNYNFSLKEYMSSTIDMILDVF